MIILYPAITDALYEKAQEIQAAINEQRDISDLVSSIKKPYIGKVEKDGANFVATIFLGNLKLITIDSNG